MTKGSIIVGYTSSLSERSQYQPANTGRPQTKQQTLSRSVASSPRPRNPKEPRRRSRVRNYRGNLRNNGSRAADPLKWVRRSRPHTYRARARPVVPRHKAGETTGECAPSPLRGTPSPDLTGRLSPDCCFAFLFANYKKTRYGSFLVDRSFVVIENSHTVRRKLG